MTISLKHKFNSPKADGGDASLVRPSNWNDEHDMTLAASRLLGRSSGSAGVAQEIPLGSGLEFSSGNLQAKFTDAAPTFHAATEKTTLVDADELPMLDSATSFDLKKVTAFNIMKYVMGTAGLDLVIGLVPQPNASLPLSRVDISAGVGIFAGLKTTIAAMTKNLSAAWAAGTGNGFLDTGAVGISKTYHIYVIRNDTTGAGDLIASLSATHGGVTAQAGWTVQPNSRIGSFNTNASSQILGWKQYGNKVKLDATVVEFNVSASTNNASFNPVSLPEGISVDGEFTMFVSCLSNTQGTLKMDTDQNANSIASAYLDVNVASPVGVMKDGKVRTTSAGLFWVNFNLSVGSGSGRLSSTGWVDYTVPRIIG